MTDANAEIPYIDPNVQYVGVSKLRTLNATSLNELDKTLVIQENDRPLAVMLSYEQFMAMQTERVSILETLNMLLDEEERNGLLAGIKDSVENKTKPLSVIRASLKKKKG